MFDLSTQQHFNNTVMALALALCFEDDEHFLTLDQITGRKLTPHFPSSKRYISDFISSIETKSQKLDALLGIKYLKASTSKGFERQIDKKPSVLAGKAISSLKQLICESNGGREFINNIDNELSIYECIEYAEFYASRERFVILNSSPDDINLKMLLIKNSQQQVFMLLWRAIRSQAESFNKGNNKINFSVICKKAFGYYLHYVKNEKPIAPYSWPKELSASKLRSVISVIN